MRQVSFSTSPPPLNFFEWDDKRKSLLSDLCVSQRSLFRPFKLNPRYPAHTLVLRYFLTKGSSNSNHEAIRNTKTISVLH